MAADSQELRDRLLQTDDEFRSLAVQHRDLKTRVDQLSSKPYLTDSEQFEAVTLKKRKLQVKDRMEEILRRSRDVSDRSPLGQPSATPAGRS